MTKLKNIPHYAIVLISISYSSYIVSEYLSAIFNYHLSLAIAGALSMLAHYYLVFAINQMMKTKKLHQSIFLGLILSSCIFFMEFKGVHEVTTASTVDRSKVGNIESEISAFRIQLQELGTSRHWAKVEQRRLIKSQLESLSNELLIARNELQVQKEKATNQANEFRFFSVILILISILATSCIEHDHSISETIENTYKNKNNQESFSDSKALAKAPLIQNQIGFQTNMNHALIEAIQNGVRDYRTLTKYGANPKQIKKAIQQYG